MTDDGGLRPMFRARLRQFAWTTVETGATQDGVSDSNYLSRGGIEGWIEFKQTSGWTPKIRPGQVGWILRRARYGGRSWIAVRRWCVQGPRREAADELWLVPGVYARELRAGGLRPLREVVGTWPGGPARWDWDAVAALLVTPA